MSEQRTTRRARAWLARWSLLTAWLLLAACTRAAAPSPTATPAPPAAAAPGPTSAPAAAATPASADRAIADFYRGKTLRIVVGHAVGGGYDIYSRLIARHLGKHIPGTPSVIVENMLGAGGMVSLNHVYNVAPKDGTVIGNVNMGTMSQQQLYGAPGVQYDAARLQFLGAPASEHYLMIVKAAAGVAKLEDVLGPAGKPLALGGTSPGSTTVDGPVLVRELLGGNVKIVSGYEGTTPVRMAVETGELDGLFNTWESHKITSREKTDSGEWLILAQMTDPLLKDLPAVPGILSFARTDDQRQMLRYALIIPNEFARPYYVAPGVPEARAAALETAFARTMQDPEFLADAQRSNLEIAPLSGAEIHRLVVEFLGMPADVQAKLKQLLLADAR